MVSLVAYKIGVNQVEIETVFNTLSNTYFMPVIVIDLATVQTVHCVEREYL